jgi:hypothetical protein
MAEIEPTLRQNSINFAALLHFMFRALLIISRFNIQTSREGCIIP